jgi:death-on-curing protein
VSIDYLELADFLLIAEAVLQTPAKEIAQDSSLNLADSALHAPRARFVGEEFYPEFPKKAAVLGAHLVKNHPLRDGNVQVALVATVEFCARNGFRWTPPPSDEDGEATADMFLRLAATPISDEVIDELAGWIAERIGFPARATGA